MIHTIVLYKNRVVSDWSLRFFRSYIFPILAAAVAAAAQPTSQKIPYIVLQTAQPPLLQNRPLFQVIYSDSLWARDNRWLLSRVQRLAGPAGDRCLLSRLETPTGNKGPSFVPVGGSNRDKRLRGPFVPVGASNRDKSHLLSRAQRLSGQMAWNKGLFCSSAHRKNP